METKSYQIEHVNLHINSYDDIRKKEKTFIQNTILMKILDNNRVYDYVVGVGQ